MFWQQRPFASKRFSQISACRVNLRALQTRHQDWGQHQTSIFLLDLLQAEIQGCQETHHGCFLSTSILGWGSYQISKLDVFSLFLTKCKVLLVSLDSLVNSILLSQQLPLLSAQFRNKFYLDLCHHSCTLCQLRFWSRGLLLRWVIVHFNCC